MHMKIHMNMIYMTKVIQKTHHMYVNYISVVDIFSSCHTSLTSQHMTDSRDFKT